MPDTGSVPAQATRTGRAIQPFWLAGTSVTACTAAGGVLSIFTTTSAAIVTPFEYVARQVFVTPGVSSVITMAGSQPEVLARPSGPTAQRSVTALRYQPWSPA